MTDYERDQLWGALQRLYDTAVEQTKQIELLLAITKKDGEYIQTLAHIEDSHHRRLSSLEGPV